MTRQNYAPFAACAAALMATSVHAAGAGLQITEVDLPHHEAQARLAIWYPSVETGEATIYGENPVFKGVMVHQDAAPLEGKKPLVLFSHGMGGTDRAQAWLGAALAERGAIVAMVNHPKTTWGDFDMEKGVRHWTRALDMRAVLDLVQADAQLSEQIDPERIMAAGFSYGGWTALSLGGARGNQSGLIAACESYGAKMEACDVFASQSIGIQRFDPEVWNASYKDARITHVAAIDPGLVWGMNAADLSDLDVPVQMMGFGGAQDRMIATDYDQSGLSDLMPEAQITQFDPAYHFTAMPLCKPAGEAILREEGDDPVCTDPRGSDRAAIHAEITDLLAKQLGL